MSQKSDLSTTLKVVVVPSSLVESIVEGLALMSVVVVCDPDGAQAAAVASRVTGHRTAVFIGDLDNAEDQETVRNFCIEMFGVEPSFS